jgi:RNA polymerase sigma-70 factor (ECF subfamily)
MTGEETAADEVLTETFQQAFTKAVEPNGEQVDASLVDRLKNRVEFEPVSPELPKIATNVRDISLAAQRNVKRTDLEEAIQYLEATERMLFLLRDVEGYPVERVATLLEMEPKLVNIGLLKARLKLREILASREDRLAS